MRGLRCASGPSCAASPGAGVVARGLLWFNATLRGSKQPTAALSPRRRFGCWLPLRVAGGRV